LDGELLGKHQGGYTSFSMKLPRLSPGTEHTLLLDVDKELDHKHSLPHSGTVGLWRNYGGPFRDVYLEILPPTHLRDIRIQTKLLPHSLSCVLVLEGEAERADDSPLIAWSRIEEDAIGQGRSYLATSDVAVGKDGSFRTSLVLSQPKIWTPQNPARYLVWVDLRQGDDVLDRVAMNVGIRSFAIKDGTLLLNDQPIQLEGPCRWELNPVEGSALSLASMEEDVLQIKRSGANAVRLLHHPHHPYFLELCDRWGLVVLEEIPAWRIPEPHLAREQVLKQARRILTETVRRDRNRPSVLAWGLGTGIDFKSDAGWSYLYDVQKPIHGLDDRPTFAFLDQTNGSSTPTGLLDLIGTPSQDLSGNAPKHYLNSVSDSETAHVGVFHCDPVGWPTEYPGLSAPLGGESKGFSCATLWATRSVTAFAFLFLFVAPLLHLYRFEERGGRALGTVLSLAAFALSLVALKEAVRLQPQALRALDKVFHALFPSDRWQETARLFFWENDLAWSSLTAFLLLLWAGAALVPVLLARLRKTPGDRVGLPPAALGLLMHPGLVSLAGMPALQWDRWAWHLGALVLSILLTATLYVRNASVRWRVGKGRLVAFLTGSSVILLAAGLLLLRAMTSLLD